MRDFFLSLMTDKRNGPIFAPIKFLLYILSLIYGAALIGRRLLYKFRIFRSERVPLKIISVGNLTLGGTGKTPFVMWLVRTLDEDLDKRSSVLIRGYGWDEQTMLKKKLIDTPIMVGEDRARSAHKAIKLYGSDTAILDDGFQHWELERNIDIVLIDARNPFGNGHLFPRGILREHKEAVRRASVIVFTKADKSAHDLDSVREDLRIINKELIFLEALHKPLHIYDLRDRRQRPLDFLDGKRVILLSSIGDPDYFARTVRSIGADIAEHIIFSDHHNYTEDDAVLIIKRCNERKFAFILTTEKDEVKLRRMSLSFGDYPVMTLVIEMEIISGKELLIDRLRSLYTRQGVK
ncbi:MAG: tetraacyldisaccharide 4'-kinase [Candidatus Omnitrophota bacterium]|nr:tetraacyldisaccharide 4'-kinase [Candidatus Omnitrophota bacterium]